jgi:hypothetical protein
VLDNIPGELRLLPQWVVAGPNKEPINPLTGQPASVTNPDTWGTFSDAKSAGYKHVGFVLTQDDPYAAIDLDAPTNDDMASRHRKIFSAFDSYAEVSQSGLGIHIIVKGSIPTGVRRDKVEVYSTGRYMIFTGNVINAHPITEHQELLLAMHSEMASTMVTDLVERDAIISDEALYDIASHAANGEKFTRLFRGEINGYPSQSEADFALLTILSFYSKSDQQVRQVFRYSDLGKRDKAQRNDDYINRALQKIRAKQYVAPVDLTNLFAYSEELPLQFDSSVTTPDLNGANHPLPPPPPTTPLIETLPPPAPPAPPRTVLFPPGLIGEMAAYVFSSAIRPVQEVALTAAIGLGAGITGRHYNISSTGLNQYIVLLAKTGTGKEGAIGGIDALIGSIRDTVPVADEFVGPGTFASGQALTRVLDKTPCFVSVLGEIGITLQQLCDKGATSFNLQLRKVLLDVYAKSGWNKWLRPSVYSDTDKNTGLVRAPNVTILGESTPENFYGALSSSHISEGLIPRFLVIEYEGIRPPVNDQAFHRPHAGLIQQLVTLCQTVLTMRNNETCVPVQIDRYADRILREFNSFADDKINNSGEDEVLKQLWNRAHIKALKLSALVAVGCNLHQPIVTAEVTHWALALVERDITNIVEKFSSGRTGSGDGAQECDVLASVEKYSRMTKEQKEKYKVPKYLLDKPNLLPYIFIKRYVSSRASFRNDRRGVVQALKTCLEDMVRAGTLQQVPYDQARQMFSANSPIYFRGESY